MATAADPLMVNPNVPLPTSTGDVTVPVYMPALQPVTLTAGTPCVPALRVKATVSVQVVTRLPKASFNCTAKVLVETPLAAIDGGLAAISDPLVLAGSPVKL